VKPSVIVLDTLDDRRETYNLILRGLTPRQRVDFLDRVLDFARVQRPDVAVLSGAKADRAKMLPMVLAAMRGDAVANSLLANEIYADIVGLCHQWQIDFNAVVVELEQWVRRPSSPCPADSVSVRNRGNIGTGRRSTKLTR